MDTQRRVVALKQPLPQTCWFFIPPGGRETDQEVIILIENRATMLHGEVLNYLRVYYAKGVEHVDYRELSHPYTDNEFFQMALQGKFIPVNRELSWKK